MARTADQNGYRAFHTAYERNYSHGRLYGLNVIILPLHQPWLILLSLTESNERSCYMFIVFFSLLLYFVVLIQLIFYGIN